jgi:hypothetical protein
MDRINQFEKLKEESKNVNDKIIESIISINTQE